MADEKTNVMEREPLHDWNEREYKKLPKAGVLCAMPERQRPSQFDSKIVETICSGEMRFMDGPPPAELREGVNEVRVVCDACYKQGFMMFVRVKKEEEKKV